MAEDKFVEVDRESFPYISMKNVDIPLKTHEKGLLRCNKYPVIATYGPYGKDVPYEVFFKKSWDQVNPDMKSTYVSWETPDPGLWTRQGYIAVRTDERGSGQSPGELDTMSRGASEVSFDVVEWCSEQEWSSGKVGSLGISYFAGTGTQWRVTARQPKGLAAIIPWEAMSDYYRDRYGKPGRASRQWGDDTLEGDLDEQTLFSNRRDQTKDTAAHRFMDEDYYNTRNFDLSSIEVPLLSVANWGGILLHLRGNVIGWMRASSSYKFLRFIVGRHDLPFYYPHSAQLQLSFLDAFLKDNDYDGWKSGQQPRVHLCLRKGDCGVDDPERELKFPSRAEVDWPIPDTQYTKFFLTTKQTLFREPDPSINTCTYEALTGTPITFLYKTSSSLEITGHILARLTVSYSRESPNSSPPTDIDLFVTLRKLNAHGKEVFYTGTMGDPFPIVKGWLRVSLRKVNTEHPFHRHYLPYRDYTSADVQPVQENERYQVDVEVWPTNTVLDPNETLVLEIACHDTQGVGKFSHKHLDDQDPAVFRGLNHIQVGQESGYLLLPLIPSRAALN
ncbi:Alpha/Beta hydrolase protein [Aspergillus flavus]|uniref:Alpha/Beta hydrolase protein n=1 Tax=Aspergillus flavus TaxID=5059 RepID=A0A5N6GWQ3_ASPFL|nr:Alpha/Beta hydrolase protein [Aspergillus flavus]